MEYTKAIKKVASTGSNAPIAHGVGRRKSAVARVFIRRKGTGQLLINGKDYKEYFDTEVARLAAATPLKVYPQSSHYTIDVNVTGGGLRAQADAVKLGIARAFVTADESLRPLFRQHDLLTVDSRVKERKKYGRKAARRRFQFVKR